jgi:PAS domain S-box-containing protein
MWESIAHQQQLLVECLEELYAALKHLELAYEALSQKNNELATAYELVEVERQRYQDLFELVPNPYLVTNRKGIIQEANLPAATLLNVPQGLLVGKPLAMYVLQKERRAFLVKLTKLHQENLGQEWEVRLQPRNSNSIDASLSVTTVGDREGRRLMLGWMLRDITEYNRVAKSELRLLRDAVQQANAPIVITSAELNEPGPKI